MALEKVSVNVRRHTIHAIIGENGAGKSTLVKILVGIEQPTTGQIYLRTELYSPKSAQDAFKNKIGLVHQHFQLAEELTGWEHLKLVVSQQKFDFNDLQKRTESLMKKFNWLLRLEDKIKNYSVGDQQRLEILRVLILEPEIIIFDEPTAVLSPDEIHQFLDFMLNLKQQGHTLILISHKLNEIKKVSDDVTILCRGELIESARTDQLSVEAMAEKMIGRKQKSIQMPDKTSVSGINSSSDIFLNELNLKIHKSQIMGVAGVEGNGQSEFIQKLLMNFKTLNLSYADISEDRYRFSIYPQKNLVENFLIRHRQHFFKNGVLQSSQINNEVQKIIENWDVRPMDLQMPIGDFSGGNQQKFVIGRELWHNPDVILAAHPCRGVDIGAQEKIHQALVDKATQGHSVILLSSDLDEVLKLSDQFIILFKGQIFGPYARNQLTTTQISQIMNGVYEI